MRAPAEVDPPWTLAAAAGISLLLSGVLLLANVAQILVFAFVQRWEVLFAEAAFAVSGLVHLVAGVFTYQADWRAAFVGAAVALGSAVLSFSWGVYLFFWWALVTPLPPICVVTSGFAGLLALLAAPRALRFARATAE